MGAKRKTIRIDKDENWTFKVAIKTYDTKGYNAVPFNLASQFLIMEVYNTTGGTIITASTDASNSAMVNAISGIAILDIPLSSTINLDEGIYNYAIFAADFPYRISATRIKKICYGPVELN